MISPLRFRRLSKALLALGVLAVVACEPEPEAGPVDRETFIAAYVELRSAALDRDDALLPEEDRERILARYGITAEDLLAFAEANGRDVEFMMRIWTDIEARLRADTLPDP